MASYRRVYDSRHLQADCYSSGTLRSVIEYRLPFYSLSCRDKVAPCKPAVGSLGCLGKARSKSDRRVLKVTNTFGGLYPRRR